MRRLNLVLLASLQLCRAKHPGFSIHDDLFAHPQFEVVFSDDFIPEADALAILETRDATSTAGLSQADLSSKVRESAAAEIPVAQGGDGNHGANDDDDDNDAPISETYELINSAPWRYLCSVPVIAPPPPMNRTATELAKAEEARELSRASTKGWELMSGLDGHCMYFTSGWWSYSFCYGKAVSQFHALPGKAGEPPAMDENGQEYILGKAQKTWDPQNPSGNGEQEGQTKSLAPPQAQLQIKGDQRYLSQRLEGGTTCDLTGRPRTIEIQYHCSPGTTTDRIGWIKEITTCTYLMVVYTPRLCDDVAFQPPKATHAHPIRCRQIISTEEEEYAWRYNKRVEAGQLFSQKAKAAAAAAAAATQGNAKDGSAAANLPQNHYVGMTIGGVAVGAKKVVGDQLAHKLPLPRGVARQQAPLAEVLASKKKDAAAAEVMDDEALEKLNLDPKTVKEFRDEMEKLAGTRGWTLQVVEVPGEGFEYVGAFDDDEGGEGGAQRKKALPKAGGRKGALKDQDGEGQKQAAQQDEEEQEGSQEVFYREEL
ncbi:glucosidase II beta subunit-like protein-domain-containing protein [Chaetomidium leptoderma]|uniref:Endoplasmic reticulum lectin n=1 Tax=Chaetomidium leptoderma TaxID=669021 RepID=A0AAN6VII9_9PEZI|nr:glucosidase II beta subunit-like protein-domain-containing protein [Chaetomidium leptoderma]